MKSGVDQSSNSVVLGGLTREHFEKKSLVQESKSITDILPLCSHRTLVAFDLDNTLIRPTHMEDLGSDQWFNILFKYALEETQDPNQAILLAVTLSDFIHPFVQVKPVEEGNVDVIERLRAANIPVIGLTARGFNLADATLKQLDTVGVKFYNTKPSAIKLQISDPNKKVYVKSGVIFCQGADKGECLQKFFQTMGKCYDVIMVDDNEKNLLRVQAALKEKESSFMGLRYSVMDQRVINFSMFRAMTKFIEIKNSLPNEASQIVKRLKLVEKSKLEFCTNIIIKNIHGNLCKLS